MKRFEDLSLAEQDALLDKVRTAAQAIPGVLNIPNVGIEFIDGAGCGDVGVKLNHPTQLGSTVFFN